MDPCSLFDKEELFVPAKEVEQAPQIRLGTPTYGDVSDHLLDVETGHAGGFARSRELDRLRAIKEEERAEEERENRRKAKAKADAVARKEADAAAKERAAEQRKINRQRWLAQKDDVDECE